MAKTSDTSDYGFSYGAGLQFNPMENVALDFSYEQSRIRSVDVGTGLPVLVTASNRFGDIKIRPSGGFLSAVNVKSLTATACFEDIRAQMVVVNFL